MIKLKIKNTTLTRHLLIAAISVFLTLIFWMAHFEWHDEMRLWRAFGDAGYSMLFATLIIGPISKLWVRVSFLLTWRREVGIWFAVLAVTHGLLIAHGWANWDVDCYFGIHLIALFDEVNAKIAIQRKAANTLGFVAFLWIAILAFTSSNRAMKWLGASSWRWIHTGSHIVFYLVAIHTSYFLFMHYTESFHHSVPPQSTFVIPFIVMSITVLTLQVASYIKVVRTKNDRLVQK